MHNGRVPLVLLPGTLCDARVFAPLLDRLPPREVLVPPLVGHDTAASMAAVLLTELPPRFALGGFSLGGIVALEMVAQAPERIAGLALFDTTARPDPEANRAVRRNAVARAAQVGTGRYVGQKLLSLYVSADAGHLEKHRALVSAMAADAGLDTFRRQSEMAISRADSRPRLGRIAVPTLVLCGEDDRLCSAEMHREMAVAIPGARLAIVPRAGHFALIEQPDAIAREVSAWLAAIDSRA
ncbi:MAG TPA: alpha/beta hydrolase [Geminicoccaceae bacterium]|nr:alpha/beta hydrolase [Geminicoccus sp.]HMU49023.1 alpha/beta hydrolase [Geminicoccaceae bacterium]